MNKDFDSQEPTATETLKTLLYAEPFSHAWLGMVALSWLGVHVSYWHMVFFTYVVGGFLRGTASSAVRAAR